jgi:hypothetical protein
LLALERREEALIERAAALGARSIIADLLIPISLARTPADLVLEVAVSKETPTFLLYWFVPVFSVAKSAPIIANSTSGRCLRCRFWRALSMTFVI